jgi:hypothetical protein
MTAPEYPSFECPESFRAKMSGARTTAVSQNGSFLNGLIWSCLQEIDNRPGGKYKWGVNRYRTREARNARIA